jgi:hypothetical protein
MGAQILKVNVDMEPLVSLSSRKLGLRQNWGASLRLWQFAVIQQNKADQCQAQWPEVAGNGGYAALG